MTKNSLQSGMVFETRDGNRYILVLNKDELESMCLDGEHYIEMRSYSDDMRMLFNGREDLDIVKVYKKENTLNRCKTTTDTIWERKRKKMSITEIERKLGYSIEIING